MNIATQNKKRKAGFISVFLIVAAFIFNGGLFSFAPSYTYAQPGPNITRDGIEQLCRAELGDDASQGEVDACVDARVSQYEESTGTEVPDDSDRSLTDIIGTYIGQIILQIAASITYLGGQLLDFSVEALILGMGALIAGQGTVAGISALGLGDAIENSWEIIRDFCNLAFVFGFVWIGIRTIIDYESAQTRKFLASLIIAALLINFSLFITKAVIDVSNILAIEIHKVLADGSPENVAGSGIAENFMNQMGLVTIYNFGGSERGLSDILSQNNAGGFSFFVLAALFLLVAGYVFAAGAILIVIRFVALILVMIFSPVLFAATVFSGTQGFSSKLWGYLFGYAFFAPVYLLFILISLRVIQGISGGGGTFAEALSGGGSFALVLVFFIITLFMIFSLLAAKKLADVGGAKAVSVGNNLRKWGQGVVGRSTVGLSSYALRQGYESADAKLNKSRTGRNVRRVANVLSLGATSDRAVRGTLKKGEQAKFGSSQSLEDIQKLNKETDKRRGDIQAEQAFKKTMEKGTEAPEGSEARINMERAVANASTKMLEELSVTQLQKVAPHLTSNQMDNLAKSDKFNESQITEINKARAEATKQIYERNKDDLSKASADHLETMGTDYLAQPEHAIRLRSNQMDDLRKKLTRTGFGNLAAARENALGQLAQGTPIDGKGRDYLLSLKPKEMANLPAKVLKTQEMAERLPVSTLDKIRTEGTLTDTDQREIRSHIANLTANPPSNISQAELDRLADLDDWLKNSPNGKHFGK